jgi:hypothetical protein
MKLITLFALAAAVAFAQERPLDNIASRQYQHEIRPLRLALDRWLHELGFQDAGRPPKGPPSCSGHQS